MDSLRRLEEIFAHFPGIGPRQARSSPITPRQAAAFIKEFTSLIEEVKKSTPNARNATGYSSAAPASVPYALMQIVTSLL